jgi:hypothetical protein
MNNFIKIYNCLLDNAETYRLNQLYLFGLLAARYSAFIGYTETTLAMLAQGKVLTVDTNLKRKVKLIVSIQ